jgi:hypothetical protein
LYAWPKPRISRPDSSPRTVEREIGQLQGHRCRGKALQEGARRILEVRRFAVELRHVALEHEPRHLQRILRLRVGLVDDAAPAAAVIQPARMPRQP